MPDDRRAAFSRVPIILKLRLFARKYALGDIKIYLCVKKEVETRYVQLSLQMMPRMEEEETDANARSMFALEVRDRTGRDGTGREGKGREGTNLVRFDFTLIGWDQH